MGACQAGGGWARGRTAVATKRMKSYLVRARRKKSIGRSVLTGAFRKGPFGVRRKDTVRVVGSRGRVRRPVRVNEIPRIAFRGSGEDRRAYLRGTSLDVWEIVEAYKAMGPERLLAEGDLSKYELATALVYYRQHINEIDQRIEENRRSEDEWRELYPDVFTAH